MKWVEIVAYDGNCIKKQKSLLVLQFKHNL